MGVPDAPRRIHATPPAAAAQGAPPRLAWGMRAGGFGVVALKPHTQRVGMAEGGDYPPFSVTNARFDENTFDGRLQQILTVLWLAT